MPQTKISNISEKLLLGNKVCDTKLLLWCFRVAFPFSYDSICTRHIRKKKADYINAFKQLLLSLSQTVNDFLHLHRNATQKWVDFDIKRHTHAFACFVFIFKINNEYDEILDKKCTSRGCNLFKNFKNVCKWRCDVEMASHMLDALQKSLPQENLFAWMCLFTIKQALWALSHCS